MQVSIPALGATNRHSQHLHALALQAFNEHLDIDAAGEFTGSGQLGNQHALIDSGHGIRIAEQREYRSADGVIHHKVPTVVEGSKGHVQPIAPASEPMELSVTPMVNQES